MAGGGRHGQPGSRGRHWLAASEQGHDVAAKVLVVVVHVQFVAGALALAAGGEPKVVTMVFLVGEVINQVWFDLYRKCQRTRVSIAKVPNQSAS